MRKWAWVLWVGLGLLSVGGAAWAQSNAGPAASADCPVHCSRSSCPK